MRCDGCQYALWDLRGRNCPECGRGFLPSDFDFVPGAVAFHCPHCEQVYYGTDRRGHLTPSAFTCVSCGQAIEMDEMVLRPTPGVDERQAQVPRNPWLRRRELGRVKAWLHTLGSAMVKPHLLLRGTPADTPARSAVRFALWTWALFLMVASLPLAVLFLVMFAGRPSGWAMMAGWLLMTLGVMIAVWVGMGLWILAVHGLLRMRGPTRGGLRATTHAIAFTAGAGALSAVPCLGFHLMTFGLIWWLVAATIAMKEAQGITGGRAAFVVITPPAALMALLFGGYLILMTFLMMQQSP